MSGSRRAKLSIFVAANLIDPVEAEIAAAFDATFATKGEALRELTRGGTDVDVVLFSLDVPMRAADIAALPPSVRALATYSVGTDHIDLAAAKARGLAVFNTPGVLGDSVSENAIFLMLGAARRATESLALIRSGAWPGWQPSQLVGLQLSGRTLGILGMGDIGTRVATRARALGMEILYSNRRPLPASHPFAEGFRVTPSELVPDCDVLLIACPSTAETRGLVDATLLSRARKQLIVVNIARGDIVDDDALIATLREGRIWAAGLDVFVNEPNVHPGYFELPNVFMLPHIGSSTLEARLAMGRILIDALGRWRSGEPVPNRVC